MRVSGFEWDEGNILHLALRHGIEPEEAEEVFAIRSLIRKTKRGHHAAFGPSRSGRLLVIVFAKRARGLIRVITGWDMDTRERRYYMRTARG
jgi:uncharacterized DUF497 family protein